MSRAIASLPTQTLVRAFALGVACGLRSIVGLSMLAFFQGRHGCAMCAPGPLQTLRTDTGKALLGAAMVAEIVVDKLPVAPPRISPAPLLGRLGLGAVSGLLATMAVPPGRNGTVMAFGAILGAAGAFTGAVAGYHARTTVTHKTGLPDAPVALVEDAVALSIASAAVRS